MAKFTPHFLDEIRARLPVSEVVGRRVVLKKAGREFRGISPFNKEKTPSFFVNDAKMAWFDFSSNKNGDIFNFMMQVDGLTFPQAVEQCAQMAGIPMPKDAHVRNRSVDEQRAWEEQEAKREAEMARWRAERDSENALYEAEMIEAAATIWRHIVPIAGTHAEAYLNGRGLPTPEDGWPDCLGFAGSLLHPTGKRFPALVARVDDVMADFAGIWRIFLHPTKAAKAPVPGEEKLGLGSAAGGAVRIGGFQPHTDVGEGLESSMGAWFLIARCRPVWATLSTSGMMNFEPPPGLVRCDQFPDGDYGKRNHETGELAADPTPAGRKAARVLRSRLDAVGVGGVINPEPPPPDDYLDIYNKVKNLWQ